MASQKKKRQNGAVDWSNMKVTFVSASSVDENPLNPACKLTKEEREKIIITIAARILNDETDRVYNAMAYILKK
ncbi:MAG: hypothetical protein KDD29_07765 [Flavobacteriales bacterium]|nr:hypothetical protein [Candidatus Omnitrophota bacterium]MCB0410101.1 hypothetical protein [Flavobacteriales bacterium]